MFRICGHRYQRKTAKGMTNGRGTFIMLGFWTTLCALSLVAVSESNAVRDSSQFQDLTPAHPQSEGITSEEAKLMAINSELHSFVGIRRTKRYALQGSKWSTKSLTYRIVKYPRSLPSYEVDEEIASAFALWSKYTDLKFTPKSGKVDIEISFERGYHGDEDPFDGRSGVLAHSTNPELKGPVHFDDDEDWTIGRGDGVNLLWAAVHEIGHALGLEHTDIKSAVMYGTYTPGQDPGFGLDNDDILGVQAIYGRKTADEVPQACGDPPIDALFTSAEGHVYVFKGNHHWRLEKYQIADGYPKLIATAWNELPNDIELAFTSRRRTTYFFKGSEYWSYFGKRLNAGYPRNISGVFETGEELTLFKQTVEASRRYSALAMRIYCDFNNIMSA